MIKECANSCTFGAPYRSQAYGAEKLLYLSLFFSFNIDFSFSLGDPAKPVQIHEFVKIKRCLMLNLSAN